jgi:Kelch motif
MVVAAGPDSTRPHRGRFPRRRIYAVGGEKREPGFELDVAESWAPGERSWTRLPPISSPRSGLGLAAFGDSVVAAGGSDRRRPLGTVQGFDPGTGRWRPLPRLRTARSSLGLMAAGERLYAVGGGQFGLSVSAANEYLPQR